MYLESMEHSHSFYGARSSSHIYIISRFNKCCTCTSTGDMHLRKEDRVAAVKKKKSRKRVMDNKRGMGKAKRKNEKKYKKQCDCSTLTTATFKHQRFLP